MSHYAGPADNGHPSAVGYGPVHNARTRKSATLGAFGFALVGVDLVVRIVAFLFGSGAMVSMWSSSDSIGPVSADVGTGAGFVRLLALSVALGLVGWVVGIVAVVTDRGRPFGVAAIALGVAAGALTMTFGSVLLVSMG